MQENEIDRSSQSMQASIKIFICTYLYVQIMLSSAFLNFKTNFQAKKRQLRQRLRKGVRKMPKCQNRQFKEHVPVSHKMRSTTYIFIPDHAITKLSHFQNTEPNYKTRNVSNASGSNNLPQEICAG
jgi:hypothetical protein